MLHLVSKPLRIGRTAVLGIVAVIGGLLGGCANTSRGDASAPPTLSPEGAEVALAMETPSSGLAELVGPVEVHAEGREIADAEEGARAKLRDKAASMGASLVTIDNNVGERALFGDKVKVTLTGRAFRPRER